MNDYRQQLDEHRRLVREITEMVRFDLRKRALRHDESKTQEPEFSIFAKHSKKLRSITYGSVEYYEILDELRPALRHHYQHERHHPEHYKNGIDDMTLIDIIEMFCDWLAATNQHDDGDFSKSIEKNKERFNMSDQLAQIFLNTYEESRSDYYGYRPAGGQDL